MAGRSKYTKNEGFFHSWSPEMAYVLGLIAADGHVYKREAGSGCWVIGLKASDRAILENVAAIMGYTGPLTERQPAIGQLQAVLHITSETMFQDLRAFGFTQHKSSELRWRDIPAPFLNHFVRGYFDGDGSVYLCQANNPHFKNLGANLVGTDHFIRGLHDAWVKVSGRQRGSVYTLPTWSTLTFSGTDSTVEFLEWIYGGSTPETRLDRKWSAYQTFLKSSSYNDFERIKGEIGDMSWELACALRSAWDGGHTNLTALSREFGINRTRIEAIVKGETWLRTDGRRSDTLYDFTIWGKTKYWGEWAEDARCLVDRETLRHRLVIQGMDPEQAMALPPDKGSAARQHEITIRGETKGLRQWCQELGRHYPTVYHRIFKMGLDPVFALVASSDELPRPEPQSITNRKVQGNSKIDWDTADAVREMRTDGQTLGQIMAALGLTKDQAVGVITNKTWHDPAWVDPVKEDKSETIRLEFEGQLRTLTEIEALTGVDKNTLYRRHREGVAGDRLFAQERIQVKERAPVEVGRAGNTIEKITEIRQAYKDGCRGKALEVRYSMTKNALTDIIGNRTWKEPIAWWKERTHRVVEGMKQSVKAGEVCSLLVE